MSKMRETTSTIRARLVRALDFHGLVNPHLAWRTRPGAGGGHTKSGASSLEVIGKRRTVGAWGHVMAGHKVVNGTVVPFGGVENTLCVCNAKQIAFHACHVFGRLNSSAAAN